MNEKKFAARLQNILDILNLKQNILSEKTGIAESTISNWLNQRQKPSSMNIRRVAAATECEYDYLANGIGPAFTGVIAKKYNYNKRDNYAKDNKKAIISEPTRKSTRHYRKLAELDEDILKEIQTWINDMELYRPGTKSWFRIEFQNRFPEFDDWKMKQYKKAE